MPQSKVQTIRNYGIRFLAKSARPSTVYLLIGVTAMMVTLSVFYNIPRCDFKLFFLLRPDQCMNGGAAIAGSMNSVAMGRASNADPERIRLQTAGANSGPKYTQHLDDPEDEVGYLDHGGRGFVSILTRFLFSPFPSESPSRGFTCPFSAKRFAISNRGGRPFQTNTGAKRKEEVRFVMGYIGIYHTKLSLRHACFRVSLGPQ